ncbi:molybdate ABC transporter substrate-binding protein [Thermus oshimai]|uniref:molybdate ABC transporter substrate-binding protein n=1 Tax=Thermus oshimai TaxID=56957 RepID=UPI000365E9CF|nr:molybdate ABC transporter substrate-binding protein [Thermus oshimai]
MRTPLILLWLLLFPSPILAQEVRVVAASDLQYALEEMRQAFQRANPQVKVTLSFGSSGKFYTQLLQGLPADLYFSAEEVYPKLLEEKGLAEPGTRALYAVGRMVLWVRKDLGLDPSRGPEILKDPKVTRIALANPVHAPYGRAAVTLLESYGLLRRLPNPPLALPRPFRALSWKELPWEEMNRGLEAYFDVSPLRQGKGNFSFVYGENISHAAQLALTGTGVGLLALSVAKSPALEEKGRYWVTPLDRHLSLEQAYVILKGMNRPEVVAFYRFVGSPEGRSILRRYGFLLPGEG